MGKQANGERQIKSATEKAPRINVKGLTLRLLLSLLLPVGVALLLDLLMGTLPWITLAASLVCIPLATVIVGNATLRDFERIVAQVAPAEELSNVSEVISAKTFVEAAEAGLAAEASAIVGERPNS